MIFLSPPPRFWDYRCGSPYLALLMYFVVLYLCTVCVCWCSCAWVQAYTCHGTHAEVTGHLQCWFSTSIVSDRDTCFALTMAIYQAPELSDSLAAHSQLNTRALGLQTVNCNPHTATAGSSPLSNLHIPLYGDFWSCWFSLVVKFRPWILTYLLLVSLEFDRFFPLYSEKCFSYVYLSKHRGIYAEGKASLGFCSVQIASPFLCMLPRDDGFLGAGTAPSFWLWKNFTLVRIGNLLRNILITRWIESLCLH